MKSLLLIAPILATLFVMSAYAQQPPQRPTGAGVSAAIPAPAPAPTPAQEKPVIPSEYHLTMTPQEVDALGAVIMELPAKIANPLAKRLQDQINVQIQEATKKAAEQK